MRRLKGQPIGLTFFLGKGLLNCRVARGYTNDDLIRGYDGDRD